MISRYEHAESIVTDIQSMIDLAVSMEVEKDNTSRQITLSTHFEDARLNLIEKIAEII